MATKDDTLTRLRKIGAKHTKARESVSDIRDDLNQAIKDAAEEGTPETVIAKESGLGRITVRRILGKPTSRTPWPKGN